MCEGPITGTVVEEAFRGVQPRCWLLAAPSPALTQGSLGCKCSKDRDSPSLQGPVLGLIWI